MTTRLSAGTWRVVPYVDEASAVNTIRAMQRMIQRQYCVSLSCIAAAVERIAPKRRQSVCNHAVTFLRLDSYCSKAGQRIPVADFGPCSFSLKFASRGRIRRRPGLYFSGVKRFTWVIKRTQRQLARTSSVLFAGKFAGTRKSNEYAKPDRMLNPKPGGSPSNQQI